MKSLIGNVAVVTGAASGIGFAVAKRFAADGLKVVLADIEDDALQRAAAELRGAGADVFAVRTDVSKLADVQALAAKTIEHYGKVHVVCNNAGVATAGTFYESSIRDWEWVIGVNLWGVIYGVQTFLPIFVEQGEECHFVNTASMAGLIVGPGMGIYCATKHAVVSLSEALYHEMRMMRTKVGVSVLCPAWVNTRIAESGRNRPAALDNADAALGPVAQTMQEFTRQVVSAGLSPDVIADRVADAVTSGEFYILTHPEMMPAVQLRMEGILNGGKPRFTPPPGMENALGLAKAE